MFNMSFDSSNKVMTLSLVGARERGRYVQVGEKCNTAEDLLYARMLQPEFYLNAISHEAVLFWADQTNEIRCQEERTDVKARYLIQLIDHFIEENLIIDEYYKAIESLWCLFESSCNSMTQDVKRDSVKTLFGVHVAPDFSKSDIPPDEREKRVYALVFDKDHTRTVREELGNKERLAAQNWFLTRYDTKRARIMSQSLKEGSGPNANRSVKGVDDELKKTEALRWTCWTGLLILMLTAAYGLTGPFLGFVKAGEPKELETCILTGYRWVFGLGLYAFPLALIISNLRRKGRSWYQNLLPRLLSGIIIGYIFLMGAEAWEGSARFFTPDDKNLEEKFIIRPRYFSPF